MVFYYDISLSYRMGVLNDSRIIFLNNWQPNQCMREEVVVIGISEKAIKYIPEENNIKEAIVDEWPDWRFGRLWTTPSSFFFNHYSYPFPFLCGRLQFTKPEPTKSGVSCSDVTNGSIFHRGWKTARPNTMSFPLGSSVFRPLAASP